MCQSRWEDDIGYNSDQGRIADVHYCSLHHPKRDEYLSHVEENGVDDGKANNTDDESFSTANDGKQSAKYSCDWASTSTGCKMTSLPPIKCQREGCDKLVHHVCQNTWEVTAAGLESESIATLCRQHHSSYKMETAAVQPPNDMMIDAIMEEAENLAAEFEQLSEEHVDFVPAAEIITAGGEVIDVDDDDDSGIDDDSTESDYNGDSDDAGSEAEIHDMGTEFGCEEETIDDKYGVDFVPGENIGVIPGAPDGWEPPGPPPNWKYTPKHGAPNEDEIDNPGNWNLFSFAARHHSSTKRYEGHYTPANAKVLPPNAAGIRTVDNWEFFYNGWTAGEFEKSTYVRDDAVYGKLKPSSRQGSLDGDILRKHGLTAERMMNDPLFFYQLLFPFCVPSKSGIVDDDRMPYFSLATICTNVYAASQGGGSGVGHEWRSASVAELVKWTGVPIRNGALDGKPGTLNARWDRKDPRFDPYIDNCMTKSRWKILKRYFKLNNNLQDHKHKGDVGFDPCTKYDLVFKALVHNMNYVTKTADLDATIDESTWGFGGYMADCGGRLINKPVSRGKFIHHLIVMVVIINLQYSSNQY